MPSPRSCFAAHRATAMVCTAVFPTPEAFAQDMVGPDWIKILLAFPTLVLYAIGEFALFLVPLLVILAAVSAVLRRLGHSAADYLPSAPTFVVLAALAGVPAFVFWTKGGGSASDPARAPIVKTRKDRPVSPLDPPVGKAWPSATGYLDLPREAQEGQGVIRVSAWASMYDTYLKLCRAGQQPCSGLRHAYLRKGDKFSFRGLPAGEYELRYLFVARPVVGGRSRPIRISEYLEDDHEVRIDDTPVLDSPRNPIIGIYRKDF